MDHAAPLAPAPVPPDANLAVPGDNRIAALADDLARRGWSTLEGWPDAALVDALAEAARAHDAAARTRPAGVGRAGEAVVEPSLRVARLK